MCLGPREIKQKRLDSQRVNQSLVYKQKGHPVDLFDVHRWETYLEDGAELSDDVHASDPEVLPEGDLEEEERDAAREQGQEVGYQEGTCKGGKRRQNQGRVKGL